MIQLLFVVRNIFYPQNLYINVAFKTRFSLYALQDENFSLIVGGQKIKKIKKRKKDFSHVCDLRYF